MSNHTVQIFLGIKEGEGNNWWSWENTDPGAQREAVSVCYFGRSFGGLGGKGRRNLIWRNTD